MDDKKFIITWCFLGNLRHRDLNLMTKNTSMHQNLLDYTYLGPVVQRADNAIQQRNRYPAKKCWQNLLRYPPVRGSSVDNAIQPVNNRGRHTNSLSFLGLAFDSVSNNQRTTRTDYRKKDWATLAYPCGVKEPTKIWHAPIMWLKNSFGSSTK